MIDDHRPGEGKCSDVLLSSHPLYMSQLKVSDANIISIRRGAGKRANTRQILKEFGLAGRR
jgi:hypothetical protein